MGQLHMSLIFRVWFWKFIPQIYTLTFCSVLGLGPKSVWEGWSHHSKSWTRWKTKCLLAAAPSSDLWKLSFHGREMVGWSADLFPSELPLQNVPLSVTLGLPAPWRGGKCSGICTAETWEGLYWLTRGTRIVCGNRWDFKNFLFLMQNCHRMAPVVVEVQEDLGAQGWAVLARAFPLLQGVDQQQKSRRRRKRWLWRRFWTESHSTGRTSKTGLDGKQKGHRGFGGLEDEW